MNVVQLITGRGMTGPAAAAINDARALLAAGHRAWVLSADEPGVSESCAAHGVPWIGGLRLGRGLERLLSLPGDVKLLRRLLRELDCSVLHTHRSDDQMLAALALRGRDFRGRVRQFRTWHRAPGGAPGFVLRRSLRQPDGLICVARSHEALLPQLGARCAVFIPPCVDTSVFVPRAPQAAGGPVRIVHAARFKVDRDGTDRGQLAALELFAALKDVPGWTGTLLGRGELRDRLRAEASQRLGLNPQQVEIREVPQTSAAAFAEELARFDLGLVFKAGSDGTSRAAVELLACGVPLLVAARDGLCEFAEDPAAAKSLPAGDTAAWAAAVRELLADRARLAERAKAARVCAERTHALAVRGKHLANVYAQVAAGGAPHSGPR